jgi:hypothetical protein
LNSAEKEREFSDVIKSTAAFLIIWRAYYGGTAGIDSAFRSVLSDPHNLKVGTDKDRAPQVAQNLRKIYREILEKKLKIEFNQKFKEQWVSVVTKKPLYEGPKPLCKFMLFIYSTDTEPKPDNPIIRQNVRVGSGENLIELATWSKPEFSSLEHIAPQTKPQISTWDSEIYSQELKSTIGNLVLMPEKENSSLGNKNWSEKKKYYEIFSIKNSDVLDQKLADMKADGVSLKSSTVNLIREGNCLRSLEPLSKVHDWNADVIMTRSRNIADLVYDRIIEWLN